MVGECDGDNVGEEAVGEAVGLRLVGEVVRGTVGEAVGDAMWSESATAKTLGGRRGGRRGGQLTLVGEVVGGTVGEAVGCRSNRIGHDRLGVLNPQPLACNSAHNSPVSGGRGISGDRQHSLAQQTVAQRGIAHGRGSRAHGNWAGVRGTRDWDRPVMPDAEKGRRGVQNGRRGVQGGRGHAHGATKVHNRRPGRSNSNRRKLPNEARGNSLPCASLGEAGGARHWRVGEACGAREIRERG